MLSDIILTNVPRHFFARNKNHSIIHEVIKSDQETRITLNSYHNTVEVQYIEKKTTRVEVFGVSYEILNLLFDKYKAAPPILEKLVKFCMTSKSRPYWIELKDTELKKTIMAIALGGRDESK